MSASLGKKNDEQFAPFFVKGGADWDTPFRNTPSSSEGEFGAVGTNPTPAAHNGVLDTEQKRTPLAGG